MGGFFTNTRKPEGLGGRLMVAMMNWGHAPVARWGRSFLRLKAGASILDLGCGGGANLAVLLKLCPDGTAVGLDYSSVSVKKSERCKLPSHRRGTVPGNPGECAGTAFCR